MCQQSWYEKRSWHHSYLKLVIQKLTSFIKDFLGQNWYCLLICKIVKFMSNARKSPSVVIFISLVLNQCSSHISLIFGHKCTPDWFIVPSGPSSEKWKEINSWSSLTACRSVEGLLVKLTAEGPILVVCFTVNRLKNFRACFSHTFMLTDIQSHCTPKKEHTKQVEVDLPSERLRKETFLRECKLGLHQDFIKYKAGLTRQTSVTRYSEWSIHLKVQHAFGFVFHTILPAIPHRLWFHTQSWVLNSASTSLRHATSISPWISFCPSPLSFHLSKGRLQRKKQNYFESE